MAVEKPNGNSNPGANAPDGSNVPDLTPDELAAANAVTETPEQINARVLAESKAWKLRAMKAERERAESLKKAAEEQGNFKSLYESTAKELNSLKATFVKSKVSSAVSQLANKSGCVDPDALMKLGNGDLIKIDEETNEVFGVDQFIEEAKKSMPYLFKSTSTPTINPSSPSGIPNKKNLSAADVAKLPLQERINILSSMQKK